ncbi:2,3-bisphosphoglycerate-dependent phosphoglycerate mutase [Gammaproteobacteria bacterium]|nr:2,3-bisphosphoglycerate-dependent phosphoglycerate mutase [Gammaproteobacteria bacterium]
MGKDLSSQGHLLLVRHGQSVWNKLNLFTGSCDVPLSKQGKQEALTLAYQLKNIPVDIMFSSALHRAKQTALIIFEVIFSDHLALFKYQHSINSYKQTNNLPKSVKQIEVYQELNERCYGELQGKNKIEAINEYGDGLVNKWRRSYQTRPEAGESIEDCCHRLKPLYDDILNNHIKRQKTVLIVCHGNTIRALLLLARCITPKDIVNTQITTGSLIQLKRHQERWVRV